MPRIRKKTSNRASTNDRAKVRHKVRETKKKKAKAAKKNPQWKSRKPKDPGIPNEFPYKDQILAEIAEERRRTAEEKEQRKTEKQKARAIASGKIVEDSEEDGDRVGDKDEEEEDKEGGRREHEENAQEEAEEEVPVLINRDLPTLQSVLHKADVVLEVVDARDPAMFRSEHVEQLAKDAGKKVLLVLNKIDTCPREALIAWTGHLRTHCPTLMFRSATALLPEGPTMQDPLLKKTKDKGKAKVSSDNALGSESLLKCLSQWAKEKEGEEALIVAVVGVANVGKSSLINSLLKRAALPIYNLASSSKGPSTTEVPQEVALEVDSQKIVLIDTPGLSFVSNEDADQSTLEEFRARDILLRNKGRIDRLKDPHPPVAHIVSRANVEDLMLLYNLPAFTKGDCTAFLSGVARANQLVKKKGELDLNGAARIVLRDWSLGKITRYTTPPASAVNAIAAHSSTAAKLAETMTQLYTPDEAILSLVQTRKERRKQGGLVRFACGSIDLRKAVVEEPWNGSEQNSDEGSDDEVENEVEVESMNVDREEEDEREEDESEEEEEEEEASDPDIEPSQEAEEDSENAVDDDDESEIELSLPSRNQKRKRGLGKSSPSPPAKKVAFTALPPKPNRSKIKAAMKSKKELKVTLQKKPFKPQSVQSSKAMKSLSKHSSATPVHKISEKKGKVANITAKTKPKAHLAPAGKSKDKSEPEAYDFGKFF